MKRPSCSSNRQLTTMKDEANYVCESCGEEIVVPIDLSAGAEQEYVEDCPVCCCPNIVHVQVEVFVIADSSEQLGSAAAHHFSDSEITGLLPLTNRRGDFGLQIVKKPCPGAICVPT